MTANTDRLMNRASIAASLALAAMLAITLALVSWPRVANALGLEPSAPAAAYAPGTAIDTPAEWHARTPVTLVLFARASCGACQKAQPFFTKLVDDLHGRADVVFVGGTETAGEDAHFARALGILDSSIHSTAGGLRVRVTPTLVLINQAGQILHAWEGVGPEAKQAEIYGSITGAIK